jgi:hypothetical protein
MTLAQIALKPITVAIEEAISSLADSRQGRLRLHILSPDRMPSAPDLPACDRIVAAGLSAKRDTPIS